MKSCRTLVLIGLILCLTLLLPFTGLAKVNKGVWYHQQPTTDADDSPFYGGEETYEGFCGTSSLTIGLHFFIPNIHQKMVDLYGPLDYHPGDNRGGLKTTDPYLYSAESTYTFIDFLSHQYLNDHRHITGTGAAYSELVTILQGVDAALNDYKMAYAYIKLVDLPKYLDDGYLGCMNTIDHHYVTIVGWEGSTTDLNARYYYYWDTWKTALGLKPDAYTSETSLVGNINNYGTAKACNCVKITGIKLGAKFRDQREDGTMLVYKFTPVDLPASATTVAAKAIWLKGSTASQYGINTIVSECAANGITDIFLLVKGTDGVFTTTTLDELINGAHPLGIKVHAWIDVLQDQAKAGTGNYNLSGTGWIDARDKNYQDYILNNIITPLVREHEIDGILLDSLCYPGNAKKYPGAQKAITNYCNTIRTAITASKSLISLSATLVAEEKDGANNYGQNVSSISRYLKFITPMTYTHNYHATPAWVGKQVGYFASRCATGCSVWAGIQTYDSDTNFVTPFEMKQCVDYARAKGGAGVAFFEYPIKDYQWEQINSWRITPANDIKK